MKGCQRPMGRHRARRVNSAATAALLIGFYQLMGFCQLASAASVPATAAAAAPAVPVAGPANVVLARSLTDLGAALLGPSKAVNAVVSPLAAAPGLANLASSDAGSARCSVALGLGVAHVG